MDITARIAEELGVRTAQVQSAIVRGASDVQLRALCCELVAARAAA